jgi:phosphomannomutase
LVLRFEGHDATALERIRGVMMALLRSVKPNAVVGDAIH